MKNVWVVFHTFENGHQIELFWNKEAAFALGLSIANDYLVRLAGRGDEDELAPDLKKANQLYKDQPEEAVELLGMFVRSFDDRCNLEVWEQGIMKKMVRRGSR